MKKIIAALLAVLLVCMMCVSALAEEVAAGTGGYDNVDFGDSFYGFCIDKNKDAANPGNIFTPTQAENNIPNHVSGEDVSNYIKIFFVEYFQEIFVKSNTWLYGEYEKDESGNYKVSEQNNNPTKVHDVIWAFTDNYECENEVIKDWINEAIAKVKDLGDNGLVIPDTGYIRTYKVVSATGGEQELSVRFEFKVYISQDSSKQNYVAYKAYSVPKPEPTATPTVAPTTTATVAPTATATTAPTATATTAPTATATTAPTATATTAPTATATTAPTATATTAPTATATTVPTATATTAPTATATTAPTATATTAPTATATTAPTATATTAPTATATTAPTATATTAPTATATVAPTATATVAAPTATATAEPTVTATPVPGTPGGPNDGGEVPPSELPKTGDGANLALWLGMLAVSVAGIAVLAARRGKMFR